MRNHLLALVALLSPVAYAGDSSHWELRARAYVDGKLFQEKRLGATDYKDVQGCIQDGLLLGPMPPDQTINGHIVTLTVACVEVHNAP